MPLIHTISCGIVAPMLEQITTCGCRPAAWPLLSNRPDIRRVRIAYLIAQGELTHAQIARVIGASERTVRPVARLLREEGGH